MRRVRGDRKIAEEKVKVEGCVRSETYFIARTRKRVFYKKPPTLRLLVNVTRVDRK
jgi:hypothetical protein